MTKSDFLNYIKEPRLLHQFELPEIVKICQSFPYFQSGHLLLSKVYQNTGHLDFERQLKLAAAYAIDRKALHSLIIEEKNEEKEILDSSSPNKSLESHDMDLKKEEELEYHDFQEEQNSTKAEMAEKKRNSDDALLEKQILSGAINSSILLEVDDEIPEIDSLMPSKQKAKTEKSEVKEEVKNTFNENEAHRFSDWLSFYKIEDSENESSEEWDDFDKKATDLEDNNSLPVKHEFYSAAKMARLSVQEHDDLITETLAKIYEDQEHFEKALNAYKKLQLKYPEKRSYFASRIIEIQNKLNTL